MIHPDRTPFLSLRPAVRAASALVLAFCAPLVAQAGAQKEEPLSASVRSALHKSVADTASPHGGFASPEQERSWIDDMGRRIARFMPDLRERGEFLRTAHYEALRAGLDPEFVLAVIKVESAFRKYAVSSAGARGYMQVMPFWLRAIGTPDQNLFHLRINLRYGCTILRHYLDEERGDYFRALGRYNGSLGQAEYPNLVLAAWRAVRGSAPAAQQASLADASDEVAATPRRAYRNTNQRIFGWTPIPTR